LLKLTVSAYLFYKPTSVYNSCVFISLWYCIKLFTCWRLICAFTLWLIRRLVDDLTSPLQDSVELWKKNVTQMDKDHSKGKSIAKQFNLIIIMFRSIYPFKMVSPSSSITRHKTGHLLRLKPLHGCFQLETFYVIHRLNGYR
jgi:hypothetical protein